MSQYCNIIHQVGRQVEEWREIGWGEKTSPLIFDSGWIMVTAGKAWWEGVRQQLWLSNSSKHT